MYIEKLKENTSIKNLSIEECNSLCQEIRNALISKASAFGGHLASNLGVVELTVAMHYVFNSPIDKFVFDVSHQCYTHKILTGRSEPFLDSTKFREVSGYTNPDESEHDVFKVGHTATSVSLASGLAISRDMLGEHYNVVAFIGDGSLSGGEALEGLDFVASEVKGNIIVIVNDNEMSIAEDHGGIYKNLKDLRESNGLCANNLFKAIGFDYHYVDDGHDLNKLISELNEVKDCVVPTVVHVHTTKGKGYEFAEQNKEQYHWTRPFDIATGEEKNPFNGERYDRIVRDYLIDKMKSDSRIATVIAAVPDALSFSKSYRDMVKGQFFDVGIAEEHAVSMCSAIAKNGGKPVFVTMSTFFQRTYDQLSQDLCINNAPAVMIVVNASVYAANDITHIGIFDIPMMANIPNLVYLAPTNKQEYLAMLEWGINQDKYPVAVRAPRNGVFDAKTEVARSYDDINKFKVVHEGKKVAIIALGDFFQMGESVCELLKNDKVDATLINPRYISGIDEEMLDELLNSHDTFVTLEDGVLEGGFGQKIASYLGKNRNVAVLNYGLKKEFLDRYNVSEIMKENRLDPELISSDILSLL